MDQIDKMDNTGVSLKVLRIMLVAGFRSIDENDRVTLWLDIPASIRNTDRDGHVNQVVSFELSNGTGQEYIKKYFPGVPDGDIEVTYSKCPTCHRL